MCMLLSLFALVYGDGNVVRQVDITTPGDVISFPLQISALDVNSMTVYLDTNELTVIAKKSTNDKWFGYKLSEDVPRVWINLGDSAMISSGDSIKYLILVNHKFVRKLFYLDFRL